ncbi:hypothetical protein ACFE04_028327 [Oxalis oulophora]
MDVIITMQPIKGFKPIDVDVGEITAGELDIYPENPAPPGGAAGIVGFVTGFVIGVVTGFVGVVTGFVIGVVTGFVIGVVTGFVGVVTGFVIGVVGGVVLVGKGVGVAGVADDDDADVR